MLRTHIPKRAINAAIGIAATLLVSPASAQTGSMGTTMANDPRFLPASNFTIKSAIKVDFYDNSGTLPLHKGFCDGKTVWYVITDASDQNEAKRLGLNFAPPLANLLPSPGQVQTIKVDDGQTFGDGIAHFEGQPDFAPMRKLIPSPMGFPPMGAAPGGMADIHYSPFIHVDGSSVVYDAPIIATGDGPFDVTTHTNTQDRVLAIDPDKMTVELLFVRGFADGQPIVYLSFDDSDAGSSVIERATFAPGMNTSPSPNGGSDPSKSARAAIFTFVNGQTGKSSPPAQGLNHVILDGHNAEDASLDNSALEAALREGGDARNVFDSFPTLKDEKLRDEYSPLWDAHIGEWSMDAVAQGKNIAQTDANEIRQLAKQGMITSPGGSPLGSANIVINCPALAFTDQAPSAPQASKPKGVL